MMFQLFLILYNILAPGTSNRLEFVLDISAKVLYNDHGSTDIEKEWMYDD